MGPTHEVSQEPCTVSPLSSSIVKLQSQVQTSVLGLGVDFALPLSQQHEQQEEPPPKSNWSLTPKDQVLFSSCSSD